MMRIKKTALSFLLISVNFDLLAEPLTLLDAYQKALVYDATLRASVASNEGQKEEINKAFAAFLPQLKASMYKGRGISDIQTPSSPSIHRAYDSSNYNFSIKQPIYNKASFANYNQAKAIVGKSNAVLSKDQLGLVSRLTGAYLDLLLSAENLNYSEVQKISVESQLERAKRKYKAGVGTVTEISEAQANLDSVNAKALEWQNGLEYSKRALENITGVYASNYLLLNPSKLSLTIKDSLKLDELLELASTKNPDIIASQNEVLAANEEIEKNSAGHYPTLDLVASRAHTESDNNYTIGNKYDTDSIGLQLNIPIYSGGYVNSAVRQAAARQQQATDLLTEKQRTVSVEVRKYYNEVVNGIARVQSLQQSVDSYEIALTGTRKGYDAGIRSNVEVLNAQEKLFAAKRDLANERYKLIYSRIKLKEFSGTLNEQDIVELNNMMQFKFD
jgi:protease secretion system outer membrane protein